MSASVLTSPKYRSNIHSHSPYCTPRSRRRKNIRTVADVATSESNYKSTHNVASKCICCICLEAIHDPDTAGIDCCEHLYHKDCIESWSRIENACPLCKQRFSSIINISDNNKAIAVTEKAQQAAYHIDLGHIIWVDCVCMKCGSDDNEELLLLCDGCDAATHTYCVGFGDHVPDGDYFCDQCQSQINAFLSKQNTTCTNANELSDSDEEYQPSPQHRRTTSTRSTNRAIRRSQRIREIQQSANIDNIDINIESNDDDNHNKRSRSMSPTAISPHRISNTVAKTQRMMVIDQNNNMHLLGFKRAGQRVRFSSLATLFSDDLEHNTLDTNVNKQTQSNRPCMMRKTSLSLLSVDNDNRNDSGDAYTPSDNDDYDDDDYDDEEEDDFDINDIEINTNLRRSKRLQNRILNEEEIQENDSSDTYDTERIKYRNTRKRSLKEIQSVDNLNINARKRCKITHYRKYSSLSLL